MNFTTSATMVPGAPGWDDWIDGFCRGCSRWMRPLRRGHVSKWDWPDLRHQLTFPMSVCWLCRVQRGQFIHSVFEA